MYRKTTRQFSLVPQKWRLGVSSLAQSVLQEFCGALIATVSKENVAIGCGKHPADWLAAQSSKDAKTPVQKTKGGHTQSVFKNGSRRRNEADFGAKTVPPRYLGGYGACDDS